MPAEGAVVDRRRGERKPGEPRPVDLDPHRELAVEVVLARDATLGDDEVEIRLVLGHAPDPLAALDRDLGRDREVVDVLAGAVAAPQQPGEQPRRRAPSVGTGDRDRELDVVADVGDLVVDDRDHQQPARAGDAQGVHLVALEQLRGALRVDREDRHQRRGPLRVNREREGDSVDERIAPGLLAEPLRHPHPLVSLSISATMVGKISPAAPCPRNGSRPPALRVTM